MKRIEAEISTTNKKLKGTERDEKGVLKDLEIEVKVQVEVPENVVEAAGFYGGEEKLMDAIQQDVARRRSNAARPLLRDAEVPGNWMVIAQQAVDAYTPGRKAFGPVTIAEAELAGATDMESLLALLRSKGLNIVTGEEVPVPVGATTE